jgi:hypothetical protein
VTGGISRADIEDLDIVDAIEMASDGTAVIFSGATVVSTTSGSKEVVLSGVDIEHDKDERLEPGDIIVLAGTTGGLGDGTFTLDVVVDDLTFSVIEAIGTSTGGTCEARHPAGATKLGVDPTNLSFTSETDLQKVLEDVPPASPFLPRVIDADVTVPGDKTALGHDAVIQDGFEVLILDGGELLCL